MDEEKEEKEEKWSLLFILSWAISQEELLQKIENLSGVWLMTQSGHN